MKTTDERYQDAVSDMAEFICSNCRDYKGMTTCEECGTNHCLFCEEICC